MTILRLLLVTFVTVTLSGVAQAGGEYQRTKNGRTMVWNSNPKPGDVATWNGDRDREGYADGFGTLTWYTPQRGSKPTIYGVYYGHMVHGKFEGPVNVHVKNKTAHAIFTDGSRTSRWAGGPVPSWKSESNAAPAKEAPAKIEKREKPAVKASPTPPPASVVAREEKAPPNEEERKPTETPSPIAEKEDEPVRPEPSVEPVKRPVETPTPFASPTPTASPTATESPTPTASPTPKPTPSPTPKPTPSPTPIRAPSRSPSPLRSPTKSAAHVAPTPPTVPATEKVRDKFDASLRALVGPPSSLGTHAAPPGKAPTASPAPTISSPPSPNKSDERSMMTPLAANLTEDDVIDLADGEAIAQSYDLGNYRPPKLDYSKAKERWTVFYDPKTPDPSNKLTRLIIAVEDKSKKVFITSPHPPEKQEADQQESD